MSKFNKFDILDTPISSLKIIQRHPLNDQRGYLERFFCKDELKAIVHEKNIQQINHTLTKTRGTVRGMHFQIQPYSEIKLVSCLKGEVYDVAIDLRQDSPTFLSYYAEILSDNNYKTLYIPEGFAHGFQTLSDDCEMLYLHTNVYVASAERGLNALDLRVNIQWPLLITERSPRDISREMLLCDFKGITI